MKLLFLDIDGVLNSSRSVVVKIGPTPVTSELVRQLCRLDEEDFDMVDEDGLEYGARFGLQTVDPVCVALVNKLLEADPEMGLILSSTHRKFFCHSKVPYASPEHLRRLKLYLTAMGLEVPSHFGVTPVLHRPRGEEIHAFIDRWTEDFNAFDPTYVILDDSNDMLLGQPLVLVNAEHGLTFSNYAEACRLLCLKEPGLVLL